MTPLERIRTAPPRQQPTMLCILRCLQARHMTVASLMARLEMSDDHTRRTLQRMAALGVVHIRSWLRRHGSPRPVWAVPGGHNAPKPPPQDQASLMRKYRAQKAAVRPRRPANSWTGLMVRDDA